jgi:hypothetical protein
MGFAKSIIPQDIAPLMVVTVTNLGGHQKEDSVKSTSPIVSMITNIQEFIPNI